jgi:hypothetical protein
MNEKKAKKIRKVIYGKGSHKVRDYKVDQKTGMLVDVGKRGEYQRAKRNNK